MRKNGWLTVLLAIVLVSHVSARGKAPRKGREPAPPPPAANQQIAPTEIVEGTGKTRAIALEQAGLRGREKVEEMLRKQLGDGGWKRRDHQLEPDYLQEMGVLRLQGDPKAEARPDQAVVVARYQVGLTRKYLDAIRQEVVEGFGKTPAAAKEQAALHAREQVELLLHSRYGDGPWGRLLEPEELDRLGVLTLDGEPRPDSRLGANAAIVARYRVALTPRFLEAAHKAVRVERMQDRHAVLLRLLGGALVVLLVTTGYLRLEDMTRGYATALLRVAAAAVVALAGLGLWLTF